MTMWGDVTPAERLRAVTRRNVDDDRLPIEAADALAAFASEPASLVVACRRVLAHHRQHGALWWVCARILAAADPTTAAREAVRLLNDDRTADRLGASLPLVDGDAFAAVIGWPAAFDEAVMERMDIPVIAVRVDGADPTFGLRHRAGARGVRIVEPWDPVLEKVAVLVVPAAAIGPERALVAAGVGEAIDDLRAATSEIWVLGGVGRVLPLRLYDAVVQAVADAEGNDFDDVALVETLDLGRVDRIAGPRGVERPVDAAGRVDCPVVPELLRPLD
jgi:hypothetical protein